ncbi:MAG: NAD-dependent epimerase/dehydratase family protein [Bacillota bacterium]|nr:NAD-dependent epimerase/dehydratase family protein [Bacillota bacterium]
MRCIVTGGAGFIGSHLVDALVQRGDEVLVIDDLSTGREENLNPRAHFVEASVCSSEAFGAIVDFRPEIVFHLAGQASVGRSTEDPAKDLEVNVVGTLNVAIACANAHAERLVFSSSAAVYGNPVALPISEIHPTEPLSPYGLSKLTAEKYLGLLRLQHGLDTVVLRYANVYGPRQNAEGEAGVVAIFVDRTKCERSIEVFGDGQQTRDFVHVFDVVAANLLAAEHGAPGPLNISTGVATSVAALHELIAAQSGRATKVVHLPPRPGDVRHSTLDNSRAREALGWEPKVDLASGIGDLLRQVS